MAAMNGIGPGGVGVRDMLDKRNRLEQRRRAREDRQKQRTLSSLQECSLSHWQAAWQASGVDRRKSRG